MGGKLAAILALVLLWGCMTAGRDFPVAPVKSIQQNVTTQRDVFGYFGEPYRRGLDSGYETWTYAYHYYELGQLRDSKELYVVFNKDGTVRSYSFTSK
ncbi:MAG: outer membrane protein assembly factor BamE [Deltaproteobacteria bacterium]|nr:outer membrane protein assembly factor BamE [Deltaproteobacteria bacterium]